MRLSVVICTRDRPDTVGQAIESVAECDYAGFDIHIMDQSTNTLTRDIVQALAKRFETKCAIVYHFLEKAGLSRAYNAGMRATSGEVVACTDDDVIVPSDWLTQISRAFSDDPGLGLLYGQVLIPASLVEAERTGALIVPHLLIAKRERLGGRHGGFRVFGMGANMAIRRSAFELVGGFDEALGGGGPLRSSQDFDFAFRMYRAGKAILLAPEVKVDHYGSRTQDQWTGTMKAYGIGDGAFYSKHIRCADPLATWLFAKVLFINTARQLRNRVRDGKWSEDEYTPSLITGVRDGAKFGIDRHKRLYREKRAGQMTVTQANAVTGIKRTKETES